MRFKCIVFLVLTFSSIQLLAQKEAYNWIWGICQTGAQCAPLYGTSIIKFNDDSIERIYSRYFPGNFTKGTAAMSDSAGNFLMAFNGKYLFDSAGTVLDSLTIEGFDTMLVGYKSSIFLKPKTNDGIYYLFNSYGKYIDPPIHPLLNAYDYKYYLTRIRVNQQGIEVLSKDSIIPEDTTRAGSIEACRHANGRDWWVFKSGYKRNAFSRSILSPYGMTFERYYSTAADDFQSKLVWNTFSSDGNKFFHYMASGIRMLDVYDFDRCTGELSNLQSYDFSEWIEEDWDYTPLNLSPDGTKVYMRRSNYETLLTVQVIQFDLNTEHFAVISDSASTPCLTPNLKHILSGQTVQSDNGYDPYMGIVWNPDNAADECNFQERYYHLPTLGFIRTPPNWANHLLGPIDGTICDSLGLDDETAVAILPELHFNIYPNPGKNVLHLETDMRLPFKLSIRNSQGSSVVEKEINTPHFILHDEVNKLSPGIYQVEIRNGERRERIVKKWIKLE